MLILIVGTRQNTSPAMMMVRGEVVRILDTYKRRFKIWTVMGGYRIRQLIDLKLTSCQV